MQERNVVNGVMAVIFGEFLSALAPLYWWLFLMVILLVTDLRFGIRSARERGEVIRISRAGRRTFNKAVDYLCWVLIAVAIGESIGKPLGLLLLPMAVLIYATYFELESIVGHYGELKGKKYSLNLWNYLAAKWDIFTIIKDKNETKKKEDEVL